LRRKPSWPIPHRIRFGRLAHLRKRRYHVKLFGILIVEDILAIGMIALLSGIAMTGSVNLVQVIETVARLVIFMVVAVVLGILIVPRLLAYVAGFKSNEMLLVTVLGLCFGFCLLVVKLEYSIALGAFVIGAVMAESRELQTIERLIEPIRDMFSAIFFVAIGLLLDPGVLTEYALPIAIITVAVVLGKVLTCSLGTYLAGHDGRTAMRVGMGLAQIGEFSFIIAALGISLKVTSDFLYPIAVAVSAITTLLTPYLIRWADPVSARVTRAIPEKTSQILRLYTEWLQSIHPRGQQTIVSAMVRRILLHVIVNCCVVAAIFLGGAFVANAGVAWLPDWLREERMRKAVIWGGSLVLALPFLVATYRKLKALGMLLAELSVRSELAGRHTDNVRRIVAEIIPIASVAGILLLLLALSASILPPTDTLVLMLVGMAALTALLWRTFVKLHARLQIALKETLDAGKDGH
jgi:CPA2 family monovalent cation:H+ antiporter-2